MSSPGRRAESGSNRAAEYAAKKRGLKTTIYPANWEKHGKAAGFVRNHDIVNDADFVVAFHDGQSRGTSHTIRLARQLKKPYRVYRLTQNGDVECEEFHPEQE